jgi:hypothetical protein
LVKYCPNGQTSDCAYPSGTIRSGNQSVTISSGKTPLYDNKYNFLQSTSYTLITSGIAGNSNTPFCPIIIDNGGCSVSVGTRSNKRSWKKLSSNISIGY